MIKSRKRMERRCVSSSSSSSLSSLCLSASIFGGSSKGSIVSLTVTGKHCVPGKTCGSR